MLLKDLSVKYNVKTNQMGKLIREHSEATCEIYAIAGECGNYVVEEKFVHALAEADRYLKSLAPKGEDIIKRAKKSVPLMQNKPVVYWLVDKSEIVYIGQTTSLLSRIGVHCRDKEFDSVALTKDFYGLSYMDFEGLMIREFNPVLNSAKWDDYEYFKRVIAYSG